MFEKLIDRATMRGRVKAERVAARIAAAAAIAAPRGVEVEEENGTVALIGPGLARRRVVDAGFRTFLESLR